MNAPVKKSEKGDYFIAIDYHLQECMKYEDKIKKLEETIKKIKKENEELQKTNKRIRSEVAEILKAIG